MCGIFGYNGEKPVNIDKINALGIFNQERGKHGCGIFINNKIYRGHGYQSSEWIDFVRKHHFIDDGMKYENKTVICHTRKASSGGVNEKNVHPFKIKVNKEFHIIGAHNGTLKNQKEIKKKFKIHNKFDVDSQTLLKAIGLNKSGTIPYDKFNIFEFYEGTAAVVFSFTNEPDTIYIFKGKSEWQAERPLFIYKVKGEKAVYFSSLKNSLEFIGGCEKTITDLECNVVYKITKGEVSKLKLEITRKASATKTTSNTQITVHKPTHTVQNKTEQNGITKQDQPSIIDKRYLPHNTNEIPFDTKKEHVTKISLMVEPQDYTQTLFGLRVYFWRGLYHLNGHKLGYSSYFIESGQRLKVDDNGFTENGDDKCFNKENAKNRLFWKGFLIKKEKEEEFLKKLRTREFHMTTWPINEPIDKVMNSQKEHLRKAGKSELLWLYGPLRTSELSKYVETFCFTEYKEWNFNFYKDGTSVNGVITPHFNSNKRYYFTNGTFDKLETRSPFIMQHGNGKDTTEKDMIGSEDEDMETIIDLCNDLVVYQESFSEEMLSIKKAIENVLSEKDNIIEIGHKIRLLPQHLQSQAELPQKVVCKILQIAKQLNVYIEGHLNKTESELAELWTE